MLLSHLATRQNSLCEYPSMVVQETNLLPLTILAWKIGCLLCKSANKTFTGWLVAVGNCFLSKETKL